jgi:hypothetical protein
MPKRRRRSRGGGAGQLDAQKEPIQESSAGGQVNKDGGVPGLPESDGVAENKIVVAGSKASQETIPSADSESDDETCDSWRFVAHSPDQILKMYLLGEPWSLRRVEGLLVPDETSFGEMLEKIRYGLTSHFNSIHDIKSPLKNFRDFVVDVCDFHALNTTDLFENSGGNRTNGDPPPTASNTLLAFAVEVTAATKDRRVSREDKGHSDFAGMPFDEPLGQVQGHCNPPGARLEPYIIAMINLIITLIIVVISYRDD